MRGRGLYEPESIGALMIRQIRIEQEDVYGFVGQDACGIGAGRRIGGLQLHPGTPVAGAIQFRQDFAKEQGGFDSGRG